MVAKEWNFVHFVRQTRELWSEVDLFRLACTELDSIMLKEFRLLVCAVSSHEVCLVLVHAACTFHPGTVRRIQQKIHLCDNARTGSCDLKPSWNA